MQFNRCSVWTKYISSAIPDHSDRKKALPEREGLFLFACNKRLTIIVSLSNGFKMPVRY